MTERAHDRATELMILLAMLVCAWCAGVERKRASSSLAPDAGVSSVAS